MQKWIIGVGAVLIISPMAWDLGRKLTNSGIYRRQCRGVVLSTSRTLMGMADFFDCSGSRRDRRKRRRRDRSYDLRGNYVAKIAADNGKIYKISIAGHDYERVRKGQYVVCEQPSGERIFYRSKAEAEKAEARQRDNATGSSAPSPP